MTKTELFNLILKATEDAKIVAKLLNVHPTQVRIGGSLALTMYGVIDRDIHDIDVIVNIPKSKVNECCEVLYAHNNLIGKKVGPLSVDKYSFLVGDLYQGEKVYPINVILDTSNSNIVCQTVNGIKLQHPTLVKFAKMSYVPRRPKDIDDINNIIEWEIQTLIKDKKF